MSITREDFGVLYEINAGTTKTFEAIIKNEDGTIKDLSDTDIYNDGIVKIYKPDGTIIDSVAISFTDRPNGVINFTVTDTIATNVNAGNWTGELEIDNVSDQLIEQRKFNFDILQSF